MKILLAVLFCVSIVDAQWQRQVITPKGDSVDTPAPHPLSYFTQYPSLRDATGDFCFMRTPEQCLILAKQQKDEKAEVRLVGKIHDFTIYDVFYYFSGTRDPAWKSILIQTGPDEYREILHYQETEGRIWPSFLVKTANDTLLGYEDDCYRADRLQEYYWFGKDGPVRIDLSPIWTAALQAVRPGLSAWTMFYDGRTEIPEGHFTVGLSPELGRYRDGEGTVDVYFHLDDARVVVTAAVYNPNQEKRVLSCR